MFSGEECPSAASPWDTPLGVASEQQDFKEFAPGHVDVFWSVFIPRRKFAICWFCVESNLNFAMATALNSGLE